MIILGTVCKKSNIPSSHLIQHALFLYIFINVYIHMHKNKEEIIKHIIMALEI